MAHFVFFHVIAALAKDIARFLNYEHCLQMICCMWNNTEMTLTQLS